jgi:predicted chitinase
MDLLSKRIVEQIREKAQARSAEQIAKGVMSKDTKQAISESTATMNKMREAMQDVVAKTISERTPDNIPSRISEPVIEGAPEKPEMGSREPYELEVDTIGNEALDSSGKTEMSKDEADYETGKKLREEALKGKGIMAPTDGGADGVQPTDGKDLPWDLEQLTKDISDNRKANLEYAYNHAVKNGLEGTELAAYMAQLEHESHGFRRTEEYASGAAYEDRKDLGNTQKGDGKKYKGRGYIQLTGRANYAEAGKDLGYDLIGDPKQVQDNKEVAADVSLWFWKNKVRPKVEDWSDTRKVTYLINGGYNGLKDRKSNFSKWMKSYTKTLPEGTSPRPRLRDD